ncbi:MAG: DUF2155 domain-containing protein [Paracoccaceae bacterium]
MRGVAVLSALVLCSGMAAAQIQLLRPPPPAEPAETLTPVTPTPVTPAPVTPAPEAEASPRDEADDDADAAGEDDENIRFKPAPFRTVIPETPQPIEREPTVARGGAVLRLLDKMTGATETLSVETGALSDLGRLRLQLAACETPETGDRIGATAFLTIWDTAAGADPRFSGWMFADSPALSALDHPRYDVWVIRCTTSEG